MSTARLADRLTAQTDRLDDGLHGPPRYTLVHVLNLKIVFAIASSLALAVSSSTWADFNGKVVGVADGDSITVLRDREQVKVRLVDIDAPEKAQPFGNRSKQALAALVHGREVLVVERGKDRYQRVLGRVYRGDLDVNAEQVRQGMAWVYRQYSKDATLLTIEADAKEQKRGLWHDPEPVPPWEWLKDRR